MSKETSIEQNKEVINKRKWKLNPDYKKATHRIKWMTIGPAIKFGPAPKQVEELVNYKGQTIWKPTPANQIGKLKPRRKR
jgi:hypothetical protein